MELNFNILDELSMIFFWIGSYGISDKIISQQIFKHHKIYIYVLLVLLGIYLRL